MNNKAYLDQIAVKGKKTVNHEPLLTPVMIKVLIAGLITLITIVIVAVMINNTNAKLTQSYERLYLRVTQFCGKKGPYETYSKYISSSQLRSYASQLETSITNTNNGLSGIWSSLNVSKDKLTKDVKILRSYSYNTDINTITKKMFGETVTNAVLKDFAKEINNARQASTLSITSSGVLSTSSSGIPIKKNTFYGE